MSLEYDIPEEIVGLLAAEETYYREMCEYTHDLRIRKKVSLEVDLPVKPPRLIARSIGREDVTKKSREEQVDEFHCFLLSKKHDCQARYRRYFDRDLPLHEQVLKLGVSVKYYRKLHSCEYFFHRIRHHGGSICEYFLHRNRHHSGSICEYFLHRNRHHSGSIFE